MKHILIIIVSLLFGCESDSMNEKQVEIIGIWKLDEVTNSWSMDKTPAADLDYEEYYEFRADSTVRKYRSDGEEALGTFTVKELSDGRYFEISYNDPDTELKESCSENEFLKIEDDKLKGGSLPCDGPGLSYIKITSSKE